jgi:hypothetical protein
MNCDSIATGNTMSGRVLVAAYMSDPSVAVVSALAGCKLKPARYPS